MRKSILARVGINNYRIFLNLKLIFSILYLVVIAKIKYSHIENYADACQCLGRAYTYQHTPTTHTHTHTHTHTLCLHGMHLYNYNHLN
jgi:hypothetical protein